MDTSMTRDTSINRKADPYGGGLTVAEFCQRWRLSRSGFYLMRQRGEAPRVVRVGGLLRISRVAELEWIAACEERDRAEALLDQRAEA